MKKIIFSIDILVGLQVGQEREVAGGKVDIGLNYVIYVIKVSIHTNNVTGER